MTADKRFISAEELLRDPFALGARILDSGFRPTFLVGVWRGGAPVGIAVQELLEFRGVATDHIAIRTSAYAGIEQRRKTVRIHGIDYLVSRLNAEDRLLLIDDVFDSGCSLEALLGELAQRCRRNLPEQIRIATVYYKPSRNLTRVQPDFFVHETEQWLVFPHELCGLSDDELRTHKDFALPFLGQ